MIRHYYETIPGWFNFQDLYKRAIAECRVRPDGIPATFVEVGSFLGKSLAFLGVEIVNTAPEIFLVSVDHLGILEIPADTKDDALIVSRPLEGFHAQDIIRRNMRPCVQAGLEFWQYNEDSATAARHFWVDEVDFVFLDAGHEYESISKDIAAWWPLVRPGGVIAGHDHTSEFPGVVRAVKEQLGDVEIMGCSFWKKKKSL